MSQDTRIADAYLQGPTPSLPQGQNETISFLICLFHEDNQH